MIKSQFSITTSQPISQPSVFNSHFVQALHDYLPSSNSDQSVSCLYFKKGSIIEVFNRDDSGWWDGQCGNMRGWFPSNYVGKIGDLKRQNFNQDIVKLWQPKTMYPLHNISTILMEDYNTKINTTQYQRMYKEDDEKSENNYLDPDLHLLIDQMARRVADLSGPCDKSTIQNIISAIKSILVESNLINKDSSLLKIYPELARQRRIILNTSSRFILKSREIQQNMNIFEDEKKRLIILGEELLSEIHVLEKILLALPRNSISNSSTSSTCSSSLLDTPRSSISSLSYSSIRSVSSDSLRQHMTYMCQSKYYKDNSKPLYGSDKKQILQSVIEYQTLIGDLIGNLWSILKQYIDNHHHVTEILDITRKIMEAVMNFLTVVEHVYSNISALDYSRRMSLNPKDPSFITFIIKKETVYSAITNLVTAIRTLTSSQNNTNDDYLCSCCEGVLNTTNECAICLKDYLLIEIEGENTIQHMFVPDMQEYPELEFSVQKSNSSSNTMITCNINDENNNSIQENKQNQKEKIADVVNKLPTNDNDVEELDTEVSSTCHSDKNIFYASNVEEYKKLNDSSSKESILSSNSSSSISNMTDISIANTTNTTATTVDIQDTINRASETNWSTDSINNSPLILPQFPPKDSIQMKSSISTATPSVNFQLPQDLMKRTPNNTLKSRLSRGLSVSSLKSSFGRSKFERLISSHSAEDLSESSKLRRLPSWMFSSKDRLQARNSASNISITKPLKSAQFTLSSNESEQLFLKEYAFTEEEMILNANGQIVGATIEALVRKLTLHEKYTDLHFVRTFFYTFRLFISPEEFLRLLINRFNCQPTSNVNLLSEVESVLWTNRMLISIRLRVHDMIKTWLESYFCEEQDACIKDALYNFVSNDMKKAMPGAAKRMNDLMTRTFNAKVSNGTDNKHQFMNMTMHKIGSTYNSISRYGASHLFSNLALFDDNFDSSTDKYPHPILSKSLRYTLKKKNSLQKLLPTIQLNAIDPVELGRQLTLMENYWFCQIQAKEMIGQEFKKKIGTSRAIHVKAMIQKSTQITSWVSDTILHETDIKKRTQVLKYWIKVGDTCLQLNNFNTLMAIRSALDSTCVNRLKKTWENLPLKYKSIWETLHIVTDSQRNFSEYRKKLKGAVTSCLPFLGIYLTDITFIEEGNSDYRMSPKGKQLINFDKYVKMAKILNEIEQFQISYKLIEVEEIQKYLKFCLETVEINDQVYYSRSLQLEPKEEDS